MQGEGIDLETSVGYLGAFVTRQSMNVLLQALERDGHVNRPATASVGKAGLSEAEVSGALRTLRPMIGSRRERGGAT